MEEDIKNLIEKIKECAREVYKELGKGWPECVYHTAMEVAFREKGITYESQRILPVSFKGHVVGESKPDFVIWLKQGENKRLAIIVDLKWEQYIKEDHRVQIIKYIQELKKQIKDGEEVYDTGFVINFVKEGGKKIDDEIEKIEEIQILKCKLTNRAIQLFNIKRE